MWLGDMYWNPARPPREAVSIDILKENKIRMSCIKRFQKDTTPQG